MAVLVCAQVVQTVGQCQSLRIGEAFAHLLDTPVDISAVGIDLFDDFTFQVIRGSALRRGLPGAGDRCSPHIPRSPKSCILLILDAFRPGFSSISVVVSHRFFIVHTQRIVFFRVVVFTHRIAYPVIAQIETAHVGMSDEYDAVKVENFTLVEVGRFPDVADGRNFGMFRG